MGRYHKLSRANAEDWYGYNDGYERGQTPKLGAVICWRKGNIKNASDGCGHVAVVEKIDSDGTITTSNSGWNSTTFYLKTIKKPYEIGGTYHFQGFIYPPCAVDVKAPEVPEPTPAPTTDIKKGDKVTVKSGAKTYTGGSLASWVYNTTFDVIEVSGVRVVIGRGTAVTAAMNAKDLIKASAAPAPAPVYKFKIGDKVSITGNLYSSPTSSTVIGKANNAITSIGKIEAGAHPYNTAESLGWVDEASVSTYVEPKPAPVTPSLPQLKVGDKVKVLKAVTYTGKKFVRWYSKYDVIEVRGDRIVIGIGRTVTAAVKRENLQKI